jgi:hypothetical protein
MNDRSEQRDEDPLDNAQDWGAEHSRRFVSSQGADGHRWNGVQTLVATWPDFDNHREETDRDIPVVVLERR